MFEEILKNFKIGQTVKPEQYSPLALAYIGDAVYNLYIRTYLIKDCNASAAKLHKKSVSFVNANAQTEALNKIKDKLTEEEMFIYKRGRNTKSTVPKNMSVSHYRSATGFEALLGYLYIKDDTQRLIEILSEAIYDG